MNVVSLGLVLLAVCALPLAAAVVLVWLTRRLGPGQPLAVAATVLGIVALAVLCFEDNGAAAMLGAALALGVITRSRVAEPRRSSYAGSLALAVNAVPLSWWLFVGAPIIRPRIAGNEYNTLGDVRAFAVAQAVQAAANGGLFGQPALLGEKNGYLRTFMPGARATSAELAAAKAAPGSLKTWALVAVPQATRATGERAFCTDSSGIVCARTDGREPRLRADGLCDSTDQAPPPPGPAQRAVDRLSGRVSESPCVVLR